MKLFIKRDNSSENSLFVIMDEFCNDLYYATGCADKIKLYNTDKICCMKIRRVSLPAIKAYSISVGKRNIKFLISSHNLKAPCYYYGVKWRIRGNIFINSFDILDVDNTKIASVAKRFGNCGDGFELNVYDNKKEMFCIATVLCLNLQTKVDNHRFQTV